MKISAFLTCEHAGFEIPSWISKDLFIPAEILKSHRGWDLGAYEVACLLKRRLGLPLWYVKTTRLLVEPNRSLSHRSFFSDFSKSLDPHLQAKAINSIYFPFRGAVSKWIENQSKKVSLIHFSIHSFTPVLNKEVRKADIGLLYDPSSALEKQMCQFLYTQLSQRGWRVRKNYPYLGRSDGHTKTLRAAYGKRYGGIEIELNQSFFTKEKQAWDSATKSLVRDLFFALQGVLTFIGNQNE